MDSSALTASRISPSDHRIAVGIGLLLTAMYFATGAFHFSAIDEAASFALTRSMLSHAGTDIDILAWSAPLMKVFAVTVTGLDGHTYALKDVAPSILMIPFAAVGYIFHVSPVRLGYLFPIIVTAFIGCLVYLAIRAQGYIPRTAILGSLTYGLASMAFPYSKFIFTQPLAELGLFVALWAAISARINHRPGTALLSGVALGVGALSAAPVWATAPICLACLVLRRKPSGAVGWVESKEAIQLLAAWAVGAGLLAGSQGIYNAARFGSPLETGHHLIGADLGFTSIGVGSWAQLISTPRGIIWFCPFVVLIPFSLRIGWHRRDRDVYILSLILGAVVLLVYSAYFNWTGGVAFGPRFLVILMPELALMVVPLLDHFLSEMRLWQRMLVGAVLILSTLTELGSSLLDYSRAEKHIYKVLAAFTPPDSFFAYSPEFFYPNNLLQAHLFTAAKRGWWDVLWMSRGSLDGLLLAADGALIVLAVVCLILVVRPTSSRVARILVGCQSVLVLGLVAWAFARYPYTAGFSTAETQPIPGLAETMLKLNKQALRGDGAIVTLYVEDNPAWLAGPYLVPADIGLPLMTRLRGSSIRILEQLPGWYDRVWVISRDVVPGDPHNGIEVWLSQRAYIGSDSVTDEMRMVPFTFGSDDLALQPVGRSFGNQAIQLAAYASELGGPDGMGWLNVWLRWQATRTPSHNYTVFVHLLDPGGKLVAQHDGPPQASYAPTVSWVPGTAIDDRHSLRLPDGLPPGDYSLEVGLYDSTTGDALSLDGDLADALLLTHITIEPSAQ